MFKYIAIILLSLALTGCAGKGNIWEWKYDNEKEEFVLQGVTEFEGRNIKAETRDGAKVETKSWELPSTFIGR